jgi:hypothetical protein
MREMKINEVKREVRKYDSKLYKNLAFSLLESNIASTLRTSPG